MAPIRTCVGCRKPGPAGALARLALVGGRVVVWEHPRPPGRGASIHPTEACVDAAIRTGAFARAFKTRVSGVERAALLGQVVTANGSKKSAREKP